MLKTMIILCGIWLPSLVCAEKSVLQLKATGNLNFWFAMQLPLFVEWPNPPLASSTSSPQSKPMPVVKFCLDISDPQQHFLSEKKAIKNMGYEFEVEFIEHVFQLDSCHILIIHKSQEYRLASLLLAIKNKPVLTVSNIEHFAEKGGVVELFFSENRLRYIFNMRVARASGIKVSSRILELADKVYE